MFLTFSTLPNFIRQAKGARKMNLRRGRDAECALRARARARARSHSCLREKEKAREARRVCVGPALIMAAGKSRAEENQLRWE